MREIMPAFRSRHTLCVSIALPRDVRLERFCFFNKTVTCSLTSLERSNSSSSGERVKRVSTIFDPPKWLLQDVHDLLHNCYTDLASSAVCCLLFAVCCYGLLSDTRGTNTHLDRALAARLGLILRAFAPTSYLKSPFDATRFILRAILIHAMRHRPII